MFLQKHLVYLLCEIKGQEKQTQRTDLVVIATLQSLDITC